MAEAFTAPSGASALAGVAIAGVRHGRKAGQPGIIAVERAGLRIMSVQARRGQLAELTAKVQAATGILLPSEPKSVEAGNLRAVWTAPDQWLLISMDGGRLGQLAADLSRLASVTDQSDSRAVLLLSGPDVRKLLAKGVMVDLHPKAFGPGDTAVTMVAHIGAQVTQLNAEPCYELMVPRSFCLSFWDWLLESSAEFGFNVSVRN